MAKKVAEDFIETLVNAGEKRVHGVVGGSLNGLTDVILKGKRGDEVIDLANTNFLR
jgi:pyruvate dehydrogenase (quinone)